MSHRIFIIILVVIAIASGCSSGGQGVVLSSLTGSGEDPGPNNGRMLISSGIMVVDTIQMTGKIIPDRALETHLNILFYLLPPQCSNCLVLDVLGIDPTSGTLIVNVAIHNPSGSTVYDTRLIVHTDDAGHKLDNPDDWTDLWDAPGGATINPFRAFGKAVPGRVFGPGATLDETFEISNPDPPVYGTITYAIDASWPDNCPEPYEINNYTQDEIHDTAGSSGDVSVDILDWQGDVVNATIAIPDLIGPSPLTLTHSSGNTWTVPVSNTAGHPVGIYSGLVTAYSGAPPKPLYCYVDVIISTSTPFIEEMFAPPTAQELQDVRNDWAGRDTGVHGYQLVGKYLDQSWSWVSLVSHLIDGERHYGLVRVPFGIHSSGSVPVLVIAHGGTTGIDETLLYQGGLVGDEFIQVWPSFRGEPVVITKGSLAGVYQSEGISDSYDRDADDAIALLNAVCANFPACDITRMAVMGASRGGGTSLRVKVRDARIKGSITFFGPTNFLAPDLKAAASEFYINHGYAPHNPLEGGVIQIMLIPFLMGEIDMQEARHRILLGSPIYFADDLIRTQLHHGALDPTVPVNQSDRLAAKMVALGIVAPDFEYFRYPNGVHDPYTLPGSDQRVLNFLAWVLIP